MSVSDKEWKYDNLLTPKCEEDYVRMANDSIDNAMNNIYSTGWKNIVMNDNIEIDEKVVDTSDVVNIRSKILVKNCDYKCIMETIYSPSIDKRKIIYTRLIDHEIIKQIYDTIHISRSRFEMPIGISDREFVTIRAIKILDDNNFIFVIRSINEESMPFNSNYVRAISNCDVHCKRLENGDVQIISCDSLEPKGWIPPIIVNTFKENAGNWLINIKNIYDNKLLK